MKYFERDEPVLVYIANMPVEEGRVVLDIGDTTIVVTRNDIPAHTRRVGRNSVSEANGASVPVPEPPPPAKERLAVSLQALKCLHTDRGWCALQAQARPVTGAELIEGLWSMCGVWLESRIKPEKREPTCAQCRERVGLPEQR